MIIKRVMICEILSLLTLISTVTSIKYVNVLDTKKTPLDYVWWVSQYGQAIIRQSITSYPANAYSLSGTDFISFNRQCFTYNVAELIPGIYEMKADLFATSEINPNPGESAQIEFRIEKSDQTPVYVHRFARNRGQTKLQTVSTLFKINETITNALVLYCQSDNEGFGLMRNFILTDTQCKTISSNSESCIQYKSEQITNGLDTKYLDLLARKLLNCAQFVNNYGRIYCSRCISGYQFKDDTQCVKKKCKRIKYD